MQEHVLLETNKALKRRVCIWLASNKQSLAIEFVFYFMGYWQIFNAADSFVMDISWKKAVGKFLFD